MLCNHSDCCCHVPPRKEATPNALGRAGRLEVGNQVLAILFLLQASKDHLGTLLQQHQTTIVLATTVQAPRLNGNA